VNGKMKFEDVLINLDVSLLISKLIKKGFSETTIRKAFSRGSISKKMAPELEEITSISALFWLWPEMYLTNGKRR